MRVPLVIFFLFSFSFSFLNVGEEEQGRGIKGKEGVDGKEWVVYTVGKIKYKELTNTQTNNK